MPTTMPIRLSGWRMQNKKKQALADGLNYVEVPVLLQVQQLNDVTLCNNFRGQIVSTDNPRVSSRWEDIYQKLCVDQNLDERKGQQFWRMLER